MTHDEARELIGSDPDEASAELLVHLSTCPECQAYRDEMRALNAKLRRALELDWDKVQTAAPPAGPLNGPLSVTRPPELAAERNTVPAPAVDQPAKPARVASVTVLTRRERAAVPRHQSPRLFAFAASIAAALVIGATLWLTRPAASLAAEIVTHVEGEPDSWHRTQPVSAEALDAVLRKSGVRLGAGMQPVVYASSCWFRGHFVPHVVVTTADGPVTVMILVHEHVTSAQHFNDAGYSGLLVPAGNGSVAVLSRTPMPLDQPAAGAVHALQSAH